MIEHLREDVASAEDDVRQAREALKYADDLRSLAELNLVDAENILAGNRETLRLAEEALEKARARR